MSAFAKHIVHSSTPVFHYRQTFHDRTTDTISLLLRSANSGGLTSHTGTHRIRSTQRRNRPLTLNLLPTPYDLIKHVKRQTTRSPLLPLSSLPTCKNHMRARSTIKRSYWFRANGENDTAAKKLKSTPSPSSFSTPRPLPHMKVPPPK